MSQVELYYSSTLSGSLSTSETYSFFNPKSKVAIFDVGALAVFSGRTEAVGEDRVLGKARVKFLLW